MLIVIFDVFLSIEHKSIDKIWLTHHNFEQMTWKEQKNDEYENFCDIVQSVPNFFLNFTNAKSIFSFKMHFDSFWYDFLFSRYRSIHVATYITWAKSYFHIDIYLENKKSYQNEMYFKTKSWYFRVSLIKFRKKFGTGHENPKNHYFLPFWRYFS